MLINPKYSRSRMDITVWGARANDPDWDSTDAIKQTISILKEQGHDKLRGPGGTYYVSEGIVLDADNMEMVGVEGMMTIVQKTWGTYGAWVQAANCRVRNTRFVNPNPKTRITNGNVSQRFLGEFRRQEASGLLITGPNPLVENVETEHFIAGIRWMGGDERLYEKMENPGSVTANLATLNASMTMPDGYWVGAMVKFMGTGGGTWASVVSVTGYDNATNSITFNGIAPPTGDIYIYLLRGATDGGVVSNYKSTGEDFSEIFQFLDSVEFAGNHLADGVEITQGAPPHAVYGSGSTDGVDDSGETVEDNTPDIPAANEVVVSGAMRCINSPEHMAYKFRNVGRVLNTGAEFVSEGSRAVLVIEMCDYYSGASRGVKLKTSSLGNRTSALELNDVRRFKARAHMEHADDYVWGGTTASIPAVAVINSLGRGRAPEDGDLQISGVFRGTSQTTQYGVLYPDSVNPSAGLLNLTKVNLQAYNSTPITIARLFNIRRAIIGGDIDLANFNAATSAPIVVQNRLVLEANCLGALATYDSRRTNGVLATTNNGLTNVLAFNLVRDVATEGTRGLLQNPLLNWDAGSPVTILSQNTLYNVGNGDYWKTWRGANGGAVISSVTGFADTAKAARVQRTAANSSTQSIFLVQQVVASPLVRQIKGRYVTLLFAARRGANFSPASFQLRTFFRTGTAADENLRTGDANVGTFTTGAAQTANVNVALDATWRWYQTRHFIPDTVQSMAACFQMAPVGTAGADDWFEVSPVTMIAGESAVPYSALAA